MSTRRNKTFKCFTYDTTPGKGMGQLASVEGDNNISYNFEYDDLGRLKKETENIQDRSFISETGYNTNSQVNQIKFPETGYAVGIFFHGNKNIM